jgi:hypothetical protein
MISTIMFEVPYERNNNENNSLKTNSEWAYTKSLELSVVLGVGMGWGRLGLY